VVDIALATPVSLYLEIELSDLKSVSVALSSFKASNKAPNVKSS